MKKKQTKDLKNNNKKNCAEPRCYEEKIDKSLCLEKSQKEIDFIVLN